MTAGPDDAYLDRIARATHVLATPGELLYVEWLAQAIIVVADLPEQERLRAALQMTACARRFDPRGACGGPREEALRLRRLADEVEASA